MKSYRFFFSHAKEDCYNGNLKNFFVELCGRVRALDGNLKGLKDEEIGFFDETSIRIAENWNDAICDALCKIPVLISAISPNCLSSPWCGKEWWIFSERAKLYEQNHKQKNMSTEIPTFIIPVIWEQCQWETMECVKTKQIGRSEDFDPLGNLPNSKKVYKAYRDRGLHLIVQQKNLEDYYKYFIDTLANKIVKVSKELSWNTNLRCGS